MNVVIMIGDVNWIVVCSNDVLRVKFVFWVFFKFCVSKVDFIGFGDND